MFQIWTWFDVWKWIFREKMLRGGMTHIHTHKIRVGQRWIISCWIRFDVNLENMIFQKHVSYFKDWYVHIWHVTWFPTTTFRFSDTSDTRLFWTTSTLPVCSNTKTSRLIITNCQMAMVVFLSFVTNDN